MKHVLVVFGTRPEVIKLAPLVHALRADGRARVTLCSTGQHRTMLDDALRAFELTSDVDLAVMQPNQLQSELVGRLMLALAPVLKAQRPDYVVVQGDTATVMAASLAGFLEHVPVAHVEAGLRTSDRRAPFPEEVYRRITGVTTELHFPPTAGSRDNLLREGAAPQSVFLVGNTVVDALYWMRSRVADRPLADGLDPNRRLVLVTAHRRESFGAPFRSICQALRDLAAKHDDIQLVYPVHLNPNVQQVANEVLAGQPRVRLLEPLPYDQFVTLMLRAKLILTDSGGIQEEAPALGIPTLVLRDKTERPEAVAAGTVRLVGSDRDRIVAEAGRLLTDKAAYDEMARRVHVYGDGRAAQRIIEVLLDGRLTSGEFQAQTS